MRIIKNINNNYALAIDNNGDELIIYGKGIGFGTIPRELEDITNISKSFYDVDEKYIPMINNLLEGSIIIASKIIDEARFKLNSPISANVIFTLADHISFAVKRYKDNIQVTLPILYDVQRSFAEEVELGKYRIKLINEYYDISLPKWEAAYIALQIINGEGQVQNDKLIKEQKAVQDITRIVENEYHIIIDKNGFNYSRFATHIQYMLKRGRSKHLLNTANKDIFESLKTNYPQAYICAEKISDYINNIYNVKLTDEELLYLMLHINRMYSHEN